MTTRAAKSAIGNRQSAMGFTLIELLAVLVILAVLAALVVPRFTGRTQQARLAAANTDISNIGTALKMFEVDNDRFPTTQEGLAALIESPAGLRNWNGPYLERGLPQDPWGNAYAYRQPGERNPRGYDLFSAGPDGRPGTEDDIGNWD